jgi:hypothetical protein
MSSIVPIVEAARLAGRGRATIYRDIEKGKLSRSVMPDGKPGVEISELSRVYGALRVVETTETVSVRQNEAVRDAAILEEKIRSLETQLRHKDEIAVQLQARIDDKQYIIDELKTKVLMIEYLAPVGSPEKKSNGFFERIFGRR